MRAVSQRMDIPQTTLAASAANKVCYTSRCRLFVPVDCTAFRVGYSGYYVTTAETNLGNDQGVTAALEIGSTVVQYTFGGQNQGTVLNGAALYNSDFISAASFGLSTFNGATIWLRNEMFVAQGGQYPVTMPTSLTGEGGFFNDGTNSQLLNIGALNTAGGGGTSI
ncbi:hypothetical protein GWG65_21340 [Bradyrhizobium sp. CSA207]|uniref:hypothetical protein n=1 Tax=Bradyrhizobium sp. CSA207 TaxID=2698826 RepID=UPI0023B11CDB|nr:hypothetical protein [Bradyrhizobium sp. CSA207]MDE5443946.1 hypothetical protein [Bradyrhizobium sp. CSA207]